MKNKQSEGIADPEWLKEVFGSVIRGERKCWLSSVPDPDENDWMEERWDEWLLKQRIEHFESMMHFRMREFSEDYHKTFCDRLAELADGSSVLEAVIRYNDDFYAAVADFVSANAGRMFTELRFNSKPYRGRFGARSPLDEWTDQTDEPIPTE